MDLYVKEECDHIDDLIKIKNYIIDTDGRKLAAIIDIEELNRLLLLIKDINEIAEDISGKNVIEKRKDVKKGRKTYRKRRP